MGKSAKKVAMDAPLPFITLTGPTQDANSKLQVNREAAAKLSQVRGPVAVVAVAGLYRTGKSFILNQLAGKQRGFDIGATIEPCTEGIWMWIVDAASVLPDVAPSATLVLLDTEGLGSYQKTETHDVKIFSLAILLSSFFIYNSLTTIDDNAMDRLSLVVELTKHIRARADDETTHIGQLSLYFPKFLWLVRDFSLELMSGGRAITASEYLENALRSIDGADETVVGRNAIRESITLAFRDRTCWTLKRPVNDEEQLQNLADIPVSEFRPEYLEQVRELIRYVYRSVETKRLYGQDVSGSMLASLAAAYVEAINTGSVPTIASAWKSVVEVESARALDDAKALYDKRLAELVALTDVFAEDALIASHEALRRDALLVFRQRAVGGGDTAPFEQQLLEHIAKSFERVLLDNRARSAEQCRRLLDALIRGIGDRVRQGSIATLEDAQKAVVGLRKEYKEKAKGPAAHAIFFDGFDAVFDPLRAAVAAEADEAESKAAAKMADEQKRSRKEYERLEKLYKEVDVEWKRSDDANRQLKDSVRELEAQVERAERARKELEEANKDAAALNDEVKRLRAENERLQREMGIAENGRRRRFICF